MGIIAVKSKRFRYIGFKIDSDQNKLQIEKNELNNVIKTQCSTLFNKNCKEMGIYLIKFQENIGILKCNHTEKENTINLLRSIKNVSSKEITINTVGTSGTIKSLISKHLTEFQK